MFGKFIYLFGFLLIINESLETDVHTVEFVNATLVFQSIVCYSTDFISIVNENNLTVATHTPQSYSINETLFPDRYSMPTYNELYIINITVLDAGRYTCINSSHYIPESSINLIVFRKPDQPKVSIHLTSTILDMGDTVKLNCEGTSKSAPPDYFKQQSMIYEWKEENILKFTGNPYSFTLTENLRNKGIMCTIKDNNFEFGIQSDSSEPLYLLPKETATLSSIGPSPGLATYKVLEGSSVTLDCIETRTNSPQISQYRWTKNDKPLLSEKKKTLVISEAVSNFSGTYGCQAKNSEGFSNNVSKVLEVLVSPVLTTVEQIETSGDGNVELKCRSSVNSLDIKWFESGSTKILHVGADFNTSVKKSTNFTCQVFSILTPTNSSPVIKAANSTIFVIYKYPPVRKQQPPRDKITYNGHLGYPFEATIEFDSYPELTDVIFLPELQTAINVKLVANTVHLFTKNLTRKLCTNFKLTVQNAEGSQLNFIHIHCYPLAPTDLTATRSTGIGQVTLKWTPKLDQDIQKFRVLFSSDGKTWTRYYSDHHKNKETGQLEAVVITSAPEKIHLFKVIADNGLKSGDSNIAFISPINEIKPDSTSIIVGVIFGVVIFVVTAIGMFIFCKYRYLPARQSSSAAKNNPKVKENDYARTERRPTYVGDNNLENYDTIQKRQYENIAYRAKTDNRGEDTCNNPYENITRTQKPKKKLKPVKP